MRRKIVTTAAVLLLLATITVTGLVIRRFLLGREIVRASYAKVTQKRDIVDATRNSLEALAVAEFHARNYFLTGEQASAKRMDDAAQIWEDESATLGLVGVNDTEFGSISEFLKAGKQAMASLNAAVAAYRKGGRDAAIQSIQHDPDAHSLDQARESALKIVERDGSGPDGLRRMAEMSGSTSRRLAQGIGALCFFCLLGSALLFVETREIRTS